ncbi:HD2 homeodomain mating-type protein [Mycena kentingensis (nom. inval.)]|nr:HD2 homeodomain mating-type protein [Mycena kentingensis (nom. inval.)]
MAQPSVVDSIRSIARTARALQEAVRPFIKLVPTTPAPSYHIPIQLPMAASIRARLVQLGCTAAMADELDRVYLSKSAQLRTRTTEHLQQTCNSLHQVPRHPALPPVSQVIEELLVAYERRYTHSLDNLQQRLLRAVQQRLQLLHEKSSSTPSKKPFNRVRRPFLCAVSSSPSSFPLFRPSLYVVSCSALIPLINTFLTLPQDFIPFLETYFKNDPFPSLADRVFMAEKGGMELRQVNVWFQNKRKRTRDEGRLVRRATKHLDQVPNDITLEPVEKGALQTYRIPKHMRQVDDLTPEDYEAGLALADEDEAEELGFASVADLEWVLEPLAGPTAFPVTFQKSRTMPALITPLTPFHFPVPAWRRKAPTTPPAPKTPVSTKELDELCHSFSKQLNTRDTKVVASPAFSVPFTFVPPSAPLPSLLTGKFGPGAVLPTVALNTIPARRSRGRPTENASKELAAAAPSATLPRKKKPTLPRRTPTKRVPPRRNRSPAVSNRTLSSSPPSRTPSLESIDFSSPLSRTPSLATIRSSGSSSGSSGPATPVDLSLPMPLPDMDFGFDMTAQIPDIDLSPEMDPVFRELFGLIPPPMDAQFIDPAKLSVPYNLADLALPATTGFVSLPGAMPTIYG